tara:strand:- start:334 stop:579 length:246 start_codon:yes stop_codon:yes gene_type:complete
MKYDTMNNMTEQTPRHDPEQDAEDDFNIDNDEDGQTIIDDGDYDPAEVAWTPDDVWFDPDGGLTGEAYDYLGTIDSKGEFI